MTKRSKSITTHKLHCNNQTGVLGEPGCICLKTKMTKKSHEELIKDLHKLRMDKQPLNPEFAEEFLLDISRIFLVAQDLKDRLEFQLWQWDEYVRNANKPKRKETSHA